MASPIFCVGTTVSPCREGGASVDSGLNRGRGYRYDFCAQDLGGLKVAGIIPSIEHTKVGDGKSARLFAQSGFN